MDYLKNIGFTSEEIENLVENVENVEQYNVQMWKISLFS